MKLGLAIAIVFSTAISPVFAQGVPDDVRCLLLSNGFVKSAKDERAKQIAAETMSFYVGRLDGRAGSQAITNAMRSQATSIDPKTAGPQMNACAARVTQAKRALQTLARNAAPAR